MIPNVYFTKTISSESLINIFKCLGVNLKSKTGVKISTGEPGGHNFLDPNLIKGIVQYVNGNIVECNTAYNGKRSNSKVHWKAIEDHGFSKIATCDILDETGDIAIPVIRGNRIPVNYVGNHITNYRSLLILSHFKGHAMAGFGGALKNMSIGLASARGKINIHTGGTSTNFQDAFKKEVHEDFLYSMADACKSVMDYMGKENIVYINVINNLSVDCDCDSHPSNPCMNDIGIAASTDPVALDIFCLRCIFESNDPGKSKMIERINSRQGTTIIKAASELGIGSTSFDIVTV